MSCTISRQAVFRPSAYTGLSDQARYLFVRLYIRKNGYFRVANLGYEKDIADMSAACAELCSFAPFNEPPRACEVIDVDMEVDSEVKAGKAKQKVRIANLFWNCNS